MAGCRMDWKRLKLAERPIRRHLPYLKRKMVFELEQKVRRFMSLCSISKA